MAEGPPYGIEYVRTELLNMIDSSRCHGWNEADDGETDAKDFNRCKNTF